TLDKDNAPITHSKPAPGGALQPLHIARSVGRIDGQFGVNPLADVGRKLEPLTDRSETIEQREIGFERCVVQRVAERLRIGKARSRAKYVAVAVARGLRQRAAHCGVIPASFAASRIFS